jgi:predicted Rdx family selenoprotein
MPVKSISQNGRYPLIREKSRREMKKMREVRNADGRLVCRVDETTGAVEIRVKDCVTLIEREQDGGITIVNGKRDQAV